MNCQSQSSNAETTHTSQASKDGRADKKVDSELEACQKDDIMEISTEAESVTKITRMDLTKC